MPWPNPLKQKLATGAPALGCWLSCPSPFTAETVAHAGFDWALIDMEHAPIGIERAAEMAMACRGLSVAPIVRVPLNRPEYFKAALDAGAWGVMVPMVDNAAIALEAARAAHYPPFGIRGVASGRNTFSSGASFNDYRKDARTNVMVIAQIESAEAVDNLAAIAGVEGIDCVFVGPYDLSTSMGLSFSDPKFEATIQKAIDMARAAKIPAGILTGNAAEAKQRIAQGFQLVSCGSDLGFIAAGAARTLKDIRTP